MAKPAIKVEGLWKEYVIGAQQKAHSTFYDMLSSSLSAPFRALRKRTTEEQEAESFWALRDVNFEVQPGEVVGIIGRNGAGKSTLLKILSRITAPTRGHVEVRGRLASLLEVGTGFHPELSGRENIFLNGAILGMTRRYIAEKFDEIVAFAEVEKFIDTPVKRYSSGMYVRLAFAVAAHLEPDILVIDEVLAVGDAEFQKRCLGKMRDVASEGRTVVFVSHNMHAVRSLCNTSVVLESGAVAFTGTAHAGVDFYGFGSRRQGSADWQATRINSKKALAFEWASCELSRDAHDAVLSVAMRLTSRDAHRPAFVAVDIADSLEVPLMQALPTIEGCLYSENLQHLVTVDIALPPLIPGTYFVSLWAGGNFSETLDSEKFALTFEISASPTLGRSHPHTPDHGYLVPPSRMRPSEAPRYLYEAICKK